jgi:hypothetical protein
MKGVPMNYDEMVIPGGNQNLLAGLEGAAEPSQEASC